MEQRDKMSKNKISSIGILSLFVLILVVGILPSDTSSNIANKKNTEVSNSIQYSAVVCRTVTDSEGNIKYPTECNHNLIYNTGKDAIKNSIGTGGNVGAFTTIALCNATAGCGTIVADNSEIFNMYYNCGLNAQAGTYASGGTGNWSVSKEFTSTCDGAVINETRLLNSTYGNFSGSSFSSVSLNTNDKVNINWSIVLI